MNNFYSMIVRRKVSRVRTPTPVNEKLLDVALGQDGEGGRQAVESRKLRDTTDFPQGVCVIPD